MKIAFLHTAAVHQQTFDTLLSNTRVKALVEAQVEVSHNIQPAWLAQAQADGITPALKTEVLNGLQALAQTADAVVCTCTTLGPLVDELKASNVFRIDYPMMQVAAATPGRVLLVACLESTVRPSSELLRRAHAIEGTTPNFEVLRCTNAWQYFEQQEQEMFAQCIAESVAAAVTQAEQSTDKFGCVVLAQASMASAAKHIIERVPDHIKVLRSPPLAVMHALLIAADQA